MAKTQARSAKKQPPQTRRGSVQASFVRAREIEHNVLCLVSPADPSQREYRAVIEVSSTNYTLRAEDEQEIIIAGYRAFLKSLSFPVQILVRSQKLDLTPYLQNLEQTAQECADQPMWRDLALSHAKFVQELASRRTLLEHRFYVIIPSDQWTGKKATPLEWLVPFGRKRKKQRQRAETLEKAQQQLELRSSIVAQQLAGVGLHCRRLEGEELAKLYYSCLTPDRAIRSPLAGQLVSAVGRTTKVKGWRRKKLEAAAAQPKALVPLYVTPEAAHANGNGRRGERALKGRRTDQNGSSAAQPDLPHLADLLAPASVEVMRDSVRLEDEYARGIAVTGFPREVTAGFLAPLLLHDEVTEISFHIYPLDNNVMLHQLMRRKNQYLSSRHFNRRKGRLDDPEMNVAEEDVDGLIGQLASGEERMFDLGFYLIVRAPDRRSLNERTERIMAVLRNLFVMARPTTFEHAQTFRSFMPEARNELMRAITLDSMSLATGFPFISNSLYMPSGVLVGITPNGEPVVIDEWDESLDNPHEFCGAITGAGKSYLYKLRMMRELLLHRRRGLQVVVIDPENEYENICRVLGGDYVRLAPGSDQHLNPFDLLPQGVDIESYVANRGRGDRLADKVQALHALFDIMLADRTPAGVITLTNREKGLLDRAIYETYRKVGITADARTHDREVPLLRDLHEVLVSGVCGKDEYGLADRLFRFVFGSLAGPFNAHTNVALNNHYVVFDIRDMSDELRPIGVFLITDFVETQVFQSFRPRKLYIDEAWSLIQHPEGGRFLANLARRARKRYLSLVTITQNPELFAEDAWGSVVASNAATKVLKKQDRTSANAVSGRFQLTGGERERLLTFGKHEALLLSGGKRVIIHIEASPLEHELATTHPRELEQRYAAQRQSEVQALPEQADTAGTNGTAEQYRIYQVDLHSGSSPMSIHAATEREGGSST